MRWLFDMLTVVGFFLTFLGTYLTIRSGNTVIIHDELIRYGLITLLLSLVGWFHWFRKYQIAKSVFKGRTDLNEAHIKAIEFAKTWNNRKKSINECVTEYSSICQLITKGLRQFHKAEINITVKYLNSEDDVEGDTGYSHKIYVKDLCRNIDSQQKRTQRATLHKNVIDYISDNTDFNHICSIISKRPIEDVYFFSNCLPCYIGYKNSHILKDWNKWWKRLMAFCTVGMSNWKLPYKSTIIVPISSNSSQGHEYIEGFLCADSSIPFVFSKKYDLVIMQEMASVLYFMTKLINQKHLVSKSDSENV